jgi:hypothetical protein
MSGADDTKSNVKGAHFLDQHPGFFDAQFFNLTHAEATVGVSSAYECISNACFRRWIRNKGTCSSARMKL